MRPQKIRLIADQPAWRRYFPEGCSDAAEMALSLDMLEALRLVDAEGMSQEVAANCMGISTPTLCRLLGEARRRVATALRDGWILYCEGGNVQMRSQHGHERHGGPHGHGPQSVRHGESCGGQRRRAGHSILDGGGRTPREDMV